MGTLGWVGDQLFGKGAEVKDRPRWSSGQQKLFTELFGQLMGGGGQATQRFPGQLPGTVGMTDMEQLSLSGLESLFGEQGLLSALQTKETFEQFYEEGIKQPALREFEEDILPQFRRGFGSRYWGTERLRGEEELYEDLLSSLTEGRAATQMSALELATQMPGVLTQSAQLGALPRLIEEAGLGAEYNEFLRQISEETNIRAQMLSALGLSPYEYFPFGPVEGFIQSTFRGSGGQMVQAGTQASAASDEQVKTNVEPAGTALKTIESMDVYNFDYIQPELHGSGRQIGLMAQQLEELVPTAVIEYEGVKYVRYDLLVPLLVKSVQELAGKVKEIEDGERT
jgi:hypothetical protein